MIWSGVDQDAQRVRILWLLKGTGIHPKKILISTNYSFQIVLTRKNRLALKRYPTWSNHDVMFGNKKWAFF